MCSFDSLNLRKISDCRSFSDFKTLTGCGHLATAFLLCFHGIEISLRQLKRVLRRQGLHKRKDHSDIREILNAIETELEGSGNSIGHRQMHQRLRIDYGLVVQKETVRFIIKELDPAGIQSRSRLLLLKAPTPKHSF